jgi:hypothetical protein
MLACSVFWSVSYFFSWSQWLRDPRHVWSPATRIQVSWVGMSFEAWVCVCLPVCCLSSVGRDFTMGLTPIQGVIHNTVLILKWNNNNNNNNNRQGFITCFTSGTKGKKGKAYPCNRPWRPIGLWYVEAPTFSRQSAHRWRWGSQLYASAALYPQEYSWYSFLLEAKSTVVRLEGLGQLKSLMTSSGNVPETFRLVA